MKKMILLIVVLTSSMLSSQGIEGDVFRVRMEKMLQQNPDGMLSWFKKVPYSPELRIAKYEYDFFYAVANYYNYNAMHGGDDSKVRASKYFKDVIDYRIPNDFANYTVRSYLYLGGIYNIARGEREIAGHIFKYVYDSLSPNNTYYYTALFWTLNEGYVDRATYNSLYQILYRANDRALVYNYVNVRAETKMSMISKLPRPEKYKPKYYTWTSGSSVATLIADDSFLVPLSLIEEVKTTTPVPDEDIAPVIIPVPIVPVPTPVPDEDIVSIIVPIAPKQEKASRVMLYINIVKGGNVGEDVTVTIAGEKLIFSSDISRPLQIDAGKHKVEISIGRKKYKSDITVSSGNYMYTIVLGERGEENILFDNTVDVSTPISEYMYREQTPIKNVKQEPKDTIYTIEWFQNNKYSASLEMDLERYNYLRGVAHYNNYIRETFSDLVLNQAEADFRYVVEGNGVDILNASTYLAFINLIKGGDSKISDDILSRAIISSGQNDYLYPTMLYWKARIGYISREEALVYNKRLNQMSLNTPIIDYTTGTTITLSDALSVMGQPIGVSMLVNRNGVNSVPDTQGYGKFIDYSRPNIFSQINYVNMGRGSSVTLQKTVVSDKLNFSSLIYQGSNIIEVRNKNTSISIMADASIENNYIFTFVAM